MGKIALINDTHLGCRNDNPNYHEYIYKFWEEQFFPYIEQNNIDTIIHLGDVLDRRKYVNFKTLQDFNERIVKRLNDYNVHIIVGNHDTYYKNTNNVNAPQELLSQYHVYSQPTKVTIDDMNMLMIPWVTPENYDKTKMMLEQESADIVLGHLEIKGFEMFNGAYADSGLERKLFRRFEKVLSGHFHKKSDDGQIYYLGTQYQITWNDYECPKGFHIFDTETRELTRVPNPITIFKKIYYDDKKTNYAEEDISVDDKSFIKLFVVNKNNEEKFDKFVNRLHTEIDLHELNIIDEDQSDITASVREDILDQSEDTLTFLGNYVEQIDTDLDRQRLKDFINKLYKEALE